MCPGDNRFVGGHPIAGRETSGPDGASAQLFEDRAWAICPTPDSAEAAVATVRELAVACGALPVLVDADEHDRVLAHLSHLPQLVSSALAASLAGLDPQQAALSGSGLRDVTRLADSDPELWGQIVAANATQVAAALRAVAGPLNDLAERLEHSSDAEAETATAELLRLGRAGRALLPGKHGRPAAAWTAVHVVIPDQPGALARLFADVAAESVNIEDLRVEHAPGNPVGIAELAVAPEHVERLVAALRGGGWAATVGSGAGTAH